MTRAVSCRNPACIAQNQPPDLLIRGRKRQKTAKNRHFCNVGRPIVQKRMVHIRTIADFTPTAFHPASRALIVEKVALERVVAFGQHLRHLAAADEPCTETDLCFAAASGQSLKPI
ncbi:hypothetical protein FQV39_08275 [Bosea sp. F3-2]|uniref:hypothetical protein n=1 Tax=Bosea sp. F3-2 TaxID=2599640 RepID=UPI0011F09AEB|nr:hypothetical protein [Bosea sp. F3-2]QEL22561.1 hypothetical protein FQV39_08275 [Bosea sp. F3-2]